jgi:hypothetical protein
MGGGQEPQMPMGGQDQSLVMNGKFWKRKLENCTCIPCNRVPEWWRQQFSWFFNIKTFFW